MPDHAVIMAVGDVFVDRPDPSSAFRTARHRLAKADVRFGNCEGVFADSWERAPSSGSPVVAPAANAKCLMAGGFDVLSLANNHSVDGGYQALLTTRRELTGLGAQTVGAGADIREARQPAVVRSNGVRIAFLGYASAFPHGYEARATTPGLAPVRAHTRYAPWELNEWNPGLVPRVTTEPFPEDVADLERDVNAAREIADVVIASFHWGDFTRPFVITDHERRTARVAIDAGADAVLGHHQHMLRGVEFYRGKPVYYGLGHYLFDLPDLPQRLARDGYLSASLPDARRELGRRFGEYRIAPREGYPLLPFHEDSRLTGAAVLVVDTGGVRAAGFCPAVIDATNEPGHVLPDSREGRRVVDYLRRACAHEELPTRITQTPSGDSGLPEDCVQLFPKTHPGS